MNSKNNNYNFKRKFMIVITIMFLNNDGYCNATSKTSINHDRN